MCLPTLNGVSVFQRDQYLSNILCEAGRRLQVECGFQLRLRPAGIACAHVSDSEVVVVLGASWNQRHALLERLNRFSYGIFLQIYPPQRVTDLGIIRPDLVRFLSEAKG